MAAETDPVADLAANLGQNLHVSSAGAHLAKQLVDGGATSTPQDLSPNEKLHFFQELTRFTEPEFTRVIDHLGGRDIFHQFLLEEVERRKPEPDRAFWLGRLVVDPKKALNSDTPSQSTVANSNHLHIRFPRKLPAVCPAILRCNAFLKFYEVLKAETECATEQLEDLPLFLATSNAVFAKETDRCDAVYPFFEKWMGDILPVEGWNGQNSWFEGKSKLDLAFFVPALAKWPLIIIEYKNEEHSKTAADPIAQAVHYYLQQLKSSPLRGVCNAPSLIVQIVGTNAKAYAAIHSGHDGNGPAFASAHLLAQVEMGILHTRDDPQQRKINAFWLAIKACVRDMLHEIESQLVINLSQPQRTDWQNDSWRPAYAFPSIVEAGSFRFQYVRALGVDKMAFLARRENGQHIVVKFVNHARYAKEAHELLARNGFAPPIFHSQVINGEWTMLIMEWMEGMKNVAELKAEHVALLPEHQLQEKRALNILHTAGFVHGDLRDANVLADTSGRVCIIDFDWTGKRATVRYPILMNLTEITWPDGAAPTELVEPHHDIWWHDQRYASLNQVTVPVEAKTAS